MTFENESEERNVSFLGSVLSYFVLCRQLLSFMVVLFVFDSCLNVFSITLLCNEVDCMREWSLRKGRIEKVKLYCLLFLQSLPLDWEWKLPWFSIQRNEDLCLFSLVKSSLFLAASSSFERSCCFLFSIFFSCRNSISFSVCPVSFSFLSLVLFSLRTRNGSLFTLTFHYKEDGGHVSSSLTRGIAFSLLFYFTYSLSFPSGSFSSLILILARVSVTCFPWVSSMTWAA